MLRRTFIVPFFFLLFQKLNTELLDKSKNETSPILTLLWAQMVFTNAFWDFSLRSQFTAGLNRVCRHHFSVWRSRVRGRIQQLVSIMSDGGVRLECDTLTACMHACREWQEAKRSSIIPQREFQLLHPKIRMMMMQAEEDDVSWVLNDQTSLHTYNHKQNLSFLINWRLIAIETAETTRGWWNIATNLSIKLRCGSKPERLNELKK